MPSLRPEDVADAVIYILSTGPNVQVSFSVFFFVILLREIQISRIYF